MEHYTFGHKQYEHMSIWKMMSCVHFTFLQWVKHARQEIYDVKRNNKYIRENILVKPGRKQLSDLRPAQPTMIQSKGHGLEGHRWHGQLRALRGPLHECRLHKAKGKQQLPERAQIGGQSFSVARFVLTTLIQMPGQHFSTEGATSKQRSPEACTYVFTPPDITHNSGPRVNMAVLAATKLVRLFSIYKNLWINNPVKPHPLSYAHSTVQLLPIRFNYN